MAATFKLQIITPEHLFFEDNVEMVVIQSTDGEIGVLAGHIPMISTIETGEIRIKLVSGKWRNAAAGEGFATIKQDEVLLLCQTVEWPEEIDVKRAERARILDEEKLRQKASLREFHLTKASLARQMVRLRITNKSTHN